jgi:LacI family transcriptional regulator
MRKADGAARLTIWDVANRAGVSIKTVSRVINSEPHVSPALRARVQHVIKEMDFQPNIFARGLSSSRSYVIGLFSDVPAWSYYVSCLQREALLECRAKGFHLVLEPLDLADTGWVASVTASHARLAFEGAILTPPACDSLALMEFLEAKSIPYVRISPGRYGARSGLVEIDDMGAAKAMTEYLIRQGHTEIAFIAGPSSHLAAARRTLGFQAAMLAAGIGIADHRVAEGDFTIAAGFKTGARLLEGPQRPTAIFAANDDMALGVAGAAASKRLSVPDDISIVGFDDSPSAVATWPMITTIRQPVAELARLAVEFITSATYRDDASNPMFRRILSHELVIRQSADRTT